MPPSPLRIGMITVGDPNRMSGGFLYHRLVAERAGDHDAQLRMVSLPDRPYPLAVVHGGAVLRAASRGSDVVIVDSLASNVLGPWLAAGRCHLPIVGSVHQALGGIDTGLVRRLLQRPSDRWSFRAAARCIACSESVAADLVAAGVAVHRICVVAPGRDLATGGPPLDLRRGRSIAALCAANWVPRKGILAVLDAVAAMPAGRVTLHLAGDEDVDPRHRQRILQRIARPDLAGRVVRHGIVAPEAMGALYDAADVFVLGSTVEPWGMVYGEALTAGLPIVGWAAGNLPHLVDDGVEGFLVPSGDVAAMAARLTLLAADDRVRQRLGRAAGQRAEKLPTWDDTAELFYATCRAAVR